LSGELLTVKQVQERLKVSERTVFNLMQRDELHGFKVGKAWRFDESEINEYIERQRKKAISRE
jgi:excisionase family DNA binding protein